jgi:hypothetical protein
MEGVMKEQIRREQIWNFYELMKTLILTETHGLPREQVLGAFLIALFIKAGLDRDNRPTEHVYDEIKKKILSLPITKPFDLETARLALTLGGKDER